MTYIITLEHGGNRFYLTRTVTTTAIERATRYTSVEAAELAITKAAKFHKKTTVRAMTVIEDKS